jgi:cellulose synthase/poly-beta-1,6-N-acetylglucosamine synthase-like glycosyltransferase
MGEQLILHNVITQEQLETALNLQESEGGRLGAILVSLGYATNRQIEENISLVDVTPLLGEMLIADGSITQTQLDSALEYQRKSGGKLGDILLSLNYISTDKLYRQIANQYHLGRMGKQLHLEGSKILPFSVARKYNCVIVYTLPDRYLMAVAVPLLPEQMIQIEAYLDKPVEMLLASQSEIDNYWGFVYAADLTEESIYKLVNEDKEDSAIRTFTKTQFFTIIGLVLALIISAVIFRINALVFLMYIIEGISLFLLGFKMFISWKGATVDSQIRITKEELAAIDERDLPVYTILVPMYKERFIATRLFKSLEELDYPKVKLDVKFLLEADDTETIKLVESLNLPSYYSVLVIPDSFPKTKPKACNFGLIYARGEYVVIYDAEDRPEPDQLKKVYLAFKKLPQKCVCIQGKLNYYNSKQNLMTKWGTQEYSMWFEQVLPGVMQLDIPVPLGGTSNHFKTTFLKNAGAWDPFNVTEDCDLGIRLYKEGFTTAVIDSRTWEEANSEVMNWIRQRSRWMKGYMQTLLVHMRNPVKLYKELGFRGFWGFQATIFGTLLAVLLNPFLLGLFVLWFAAKPDWIMTIFPTAVYFTALFLFVMGNFFFIYSSVVGMYFVINDMEAKNRKGVLSYSLVKWVVLLPFYWLLMSVASYKALFELIIRPSHWEKTEHGLSEERHNTMGEPVH